MVFSSIPFIFFFLPVALILYYLVPFKLKNYCLLIFSLIFYAWGEPIYILIMLLSSIVDYCAGLLIAKYENKNNLKRLFLIFSLFTNIGLLSVFKYSGFIVDNLNNLFNLSLNSPDLALPIGISFFTFQTMSYSIDVYMGRVKPEKNFLYFLTYVSMFPQLIAGPIVRYQTVSEELHHRTISFTKFSKGLRRFLFGLFKKVLIANILGSVWISISNDITNTVSLTALIGLISYAFQIYYDFSGYSDMAIGMGLMLGFTYEENFNYPYISKSITEFWRRWHMSLSTFFKDYVYIPLGGNRTSKVRNIINILIVWTITGLWHGASWNFVLWGFYYGVLLIIEKFFLKKYLDKMPSIINHIYAIIFILLGWLIFASVDLTMLSNFLKSLCGFNGIYNHTTIFYATSYFVPLLIASIISTPIYLKYKEWVNKQKYEFVFYIIESIIIIILFITTIALLVSDTYNPFLYFRF